MILSSVQEMVDMADEFMQSEAYGAAAHYFYKAIMLDEEHLGAWVGLAASVGLMSDYYEMQAVLARYVLKKLPFQEELIPLALISFKNNPRALAEWLRLTSQSKGITKRRKQDLFSKAAQLESIYREMVEEYGLEELEDEGMISLEEISETDLELDWMLEETVDEILNSLQEWIETPQLAALGIGMIRYYPHLRSERILRRFCRNEENDPRLKTRALLALRWLGVQGNVRVEKFGMSYIVNLDKPMPELTAEFPDVFWHVSDWIELWIAVEEGIIDQDQFARWSREPQKYRDEIDETVDSEEIPDILVNVTETMLQNVYLYYYPDIPNEPDPEEWGTAVLDLLREWEDATGDGWKYRKPVMDSRMENRKSYILAATPDYYQQLSATDESATS